MCNGNNPPPVTPPTPLPITIYVSRIGNSTNLSLKQGNSAPGSPSDPGDDTLVTSVELNQVIEWKVDPNPDPGRKNDITLLHIKAANTTIPKYKNSQQLLVNDQYAAVAGVITGAIVGVSLTPTQPNTKPFENYQIGFCLNSDPTQTEVWDDPKLIMKT